MMEMINDSVATVMRHYKAGNFNWPMIIYISLAHVASIIGLFCIPSCHPYTLLWAFILWPISGGCGITAGAHRLWAHRSYKATLPLRVFLMLCNSIANQGSIWHWSRDHRVHHKHSEVLHCQSSCSLVIIIAMIILIIIIAVVILYSDGCGPSQRNEGLLLRTHRLAVLEEAQRHC